MHKSLFYTEGAYPCCFLNCWHGNLARTIQLSTDVDRLVTESPDPSTPSSSHVHVNVLQLVLRSTTK